MSAQAVWGSARLSRKTTKACESAANVEMKRGRKELRWANVA